MMELVSSPHHRKKKFHYMYLETVEKYCKNIYEQSAVTSATGL